MAIKKTISSSGCCGNNGGGTITFYLDKTLTKNVLPTFENAGYVVPSHYTTSGIFYVRSPDGQIVANSSFGVTKLQ